MRREDFISVIWLGLLLVAFVILLWKCSLL